MFEEEGNPRVVIICGEVGAFAAASPHFSKTFTAQEVVGQEPSEAVTKDGNYSPRRAGACLPPITGGHKARRYAELETVLVEALWLPDMSNELMSQPPSVPATPFGWHDHRDRTLQHRMKST